MSGSSFNITDRIPAVNPPVIIEITDAAQLEKLAVAGVITVSSDLTLDMKALVFTASRFVVNINVTLQITGGHRENAGFVYLGTGTFFSGDGSLEVHDKIFLVAGGPGTLLDLTGQINSDRLILSNIILLNWINLGTYTGGGAFLNRVSYNNVTGGWTFVDNHTVVAFTHLLIGASRTLPLFTLRSKIATGYAFTGLNLGALAASGPVFDFPTNLNLETRINIDIVSSLPGTLFKEPSVFDSTLNSVADGTISNGAITAQSDNGAGGTKHLSTTLYFEDEEVTISSTTSYNGEFKIFNVVAGVSFDTFTTFVADDATGTVATVRLALTMAGGHGITAGQDLKIINTNFYNGFVTALNVATNLVTVNGTFISTNAGSVERDGSLDQTDRRIFAQNNFGFADSELIACGHVNNNAEIILGANITNDTFRDLLFGTVGSALLASTTMERWRLIDELNGTFEYIGNDAFNGRITFDFTVESAGGTADFRFKWQIDTGSGFVDLPDNVESLVAVGSDAQSVTKTFPLAVTRGDKIKPQITRNSGNSGITTIYATIYAAG